MPIQGESQIDFKFSLRHMTLLVEWVNFCYVKGSFNRHRVSKISDKISEFYFYIESQNSIVI